jgi:hypothetical protein
MRFIKTILPLTLFIVIGVFGVYSQAIIQTGISVFYWFLIPCFVLGIYYAFALTLKYERNKGGGVALGRIGITIFVTMLSFRAIQGYVIYLNCYTGKQIEREITGVVSYVYFPKPRKIFDKNSIEVTLSGSDERISLEVKTDDYYLGQVFTKKMTLGSLGILYSSK